MAIIIAAGYYTLLDGQHSPLEAYHGVFFKGRETLWGYNKTFFSDEHDRVKWLLYYLTTG